MGKLEKFQQLKEETENKQTEVNKLEGAIEQLLKQLQEEFSCKNNQTGKTITQDSQERTGFLT